MGSRRVRTRAAAAVLTITVGAAAGVGCGGGGGDAKASKQDYYAAINGFCGDVATAAKQVSKDTVKAQKATGSSQAARLRIITTSLEQFADSTESALGKLEKAGVPDSFAAYQKGTAAGFRTYIATLRKTAKDSAKDTSALTRLQARLNAVKLPDPPKDVTANAKACAEFSPAAG